MWRGRDPRLSLGFSPGERPNWDSEQGRQIATADHKGGGHVVRSGARQRGNQL